MKHQPLAIIIATILTAFSYMLGVYFNWDMTQGIWLAVEVGAVFASYWCTYLCVFQSRTNYPVGAASVILLALTFYHQGLYASALLQIYLIAVFVFGFWWWRNDNNTRPVSTVSLSMWPVYIILTAIVGGTFVWLNSKLGGTNPLLDTSVLVLSILAQYLLDTKKLENWIVWIVVDVLSVIDYWPIGLKIVAIQMGLFGLNAIWGYYMWYKSRTIATPAIVNNFPNDNWLYTQEKI